MQGGKSNLLFLFILIFLIHLPFSQGSYVMDKVNSFFFDPLKDNSNIDLQLSRNYTIIEKGIRILQRTFRDNFTVMSNNCSAFKKANALPYPLFLVNDPFGPDVPGEKELSSGEKRAISIKGNGFVCTASTYGFFVPFHHFRFFINASKENVIKLVIYWNGTFDSDQVRLLLWNYNSFGGRGSWSCVRSIERKDLNTIVIADNPKDYVSKKGYVDVIVLPAIDNANPPTMIKTYYISLSVTVSHYHKEAIIVTKPIDPGALWRWEAVKYNRLLSFGTEVKCFILDQNARVIKSLEGNEEGFSERYISICKLSNEYPRIRLKFVLKTKDPKVSPYLLNYTVLWQRDERKWRDTLTWNYANDPRIDEVGKDYIISTPIYSPPGYWWSKLHFNSSGTVRISILDEKKNTIVANASDGYNMSSLCYKAIRLKAKFIGNETKRPILENWSIVFNESKEPPEFEKINVSYANKPIENFTVRVWDEDPGLLPSTAKYRLVYKKNETLKFFISDWLPAKCSAESCSKEAVLIAENVHIFYDPELENILNLSGEREITLCYIQFYIEDAAGNGATEKYKILIDTTPPKSRILESVSDLGFYHGFEYINLSAEAVDNETGIKSVTLYFFISFDNMTFDGPYEYETLSSPPWNWSFLPLGSAYYAFLTIAVDNAGNVEKKTEKEIILMCDTRKPDPPQFERKVHWLSSNEVNFVNFSDDLLLYKIRYKIKGQGFVWHDVAEGINARSFNQSWKFDQYDWEMMEEGKEYYVYFDITDRVGNEYLTPEDGEALLIAKDTRKPVAEIDKIKVWQWKTPIKLTTYVSDKESGIRKVELFYRFSPDNKTWSEWKLYGVVEKVSGEYTWDFSAPDGDGYYEIYIRAVDFAGNEEISECEIVGITIFPFKYVATFISAFVVFAVVAFIVAKRF
ncbi:MAG: hypothetical protein DRN03_02005 [Thermoplasmata archaeon]|nr:MAG: hypothetical protein DRN03_02005 [Thermoplasmata archaeon]